MIEHPASSIWDRPGGDLPFSLSPLLPFPLSPLLPFPLSPCLHYNETVRGAGTITVVAGGVPVLAAWVLGLYGFSDAYHAVTDVLAEFLALLLLVLAWRFRRGRLAVAALLLALANFLIRGPLAFNPPGPGVVALAFLVPVCLAVLALLPERPITHVMILSSIVIVMLLAIFAHALGATPAVVADGGPLRGIGALFATPDVARLTFLIAGAFIALAFAARRGVFEGSLLWVLAATALALLGGHGVHAATLAFTAAQLVLLLGLVEDSYRLAYHDELTGLPGRRALDEVLSTLNGSYALAMVDVDHFKKFNDRHGHSAGDQALRMVAAELQKVSGGGRSYRYGGEEFAVVFPTTPPAEAREPLEKVRSSIADRKFAIRAPDRPRKKPTQAKLKSRPPRLISVSVSIGLAGPDSRRPTAESVLRAADRALYRAKNSGRNRLVAVGDSKKSSRR